MNVSTRSAFLLSVAGMMVLVGCAESAKSTSAGARPAGATVAQAKAARPAPRTTRDANGRLVTLADLTGNSPTIGQTMSLADSTPGETALGLSEPDSTFDNLEIVGDGLHGKLDVMRVGSDRTDANLLSVFAGVKNRTAQRLKVEMQTIYRDKDGRALGDGRSSWIPITLKPHEETQYRSVAISEDATDFLVRIRPAAESTSSNP
jgi:hypothetical protein